MNEKTIKVRKIFEGRIIDLEVVDVELEDGVRSTREVVRHGGAAAVLCELPGKGFIFVRQFRKAVEREVMEIVAGCLERGETPRQCAIREVKEETGYGIESMTKLGVIWPSPGYTSETLHLFYARLSAVKGKKMPDGDERLRTVRLCVAGVELAMRSNRIKDAKTIAAWSLWKETTT